MQITSVSEFLAKCLGNPLVKRAETTVFYRGVNQFFPNPHIPSLYYPPHEYYKNEDKILREVISIFPEEVLAQRSTVEKLCLMGHYRFPTRIMDISKNALVALFFACFANKGDETSLKKDGVVYVYAVPEEKIKFSDSDTVSVLANLCKRPNSFSIKDIMSQDRKEFNTHQRVLYLVYDIQEEKPQFTPLINPQHINSVVCLRPRMNNPRIIRQDGYFFLFGIEGEKKNCAKMPPEWIRDPITIPAEHKQDILAELKTMDYHEGFFYPDFEHVSEVIRERYSSKRQ